jgi:peptidoglycan/LPS O-acetylase OafA/YrhL
VSALPASRGWRLRPDRVSDGAIRYSAAPSFDLMPGLDGLRGVSILLVIASHLGMGMVVPGGLGVTVFFFISGLLITRQLLAEQAATGSIRLGLFYARRLLRLYPPLIVMVAVGGLLFAWLGGPVVWKQVLSALFYFYNYAPMVFGWFGTPLGNSPFDVLWSLAVEEHFYLLFPIILLMFGRDRNRFALIMVGCLVLVLAWRWHLLAACEQGANVCLGVSSQQRIEASTDTRLDSILYGALLATLLGSRWAHRTLRLIDSPIAFVAGAGCLLLSLAIRNPNFRDTLRYSLQGVGLLLAIGSLLFAPRLDSVRMILACPVSRLVGRLSYSIYLWHWVLISCLLQYRFGHMDMADPVQFTWLFHAAVPIVLAALVCAYCSYYGVERPVLTLRRRLGSHVVADRAPTG